MKRLLFILLAMVLGAGLVFAGTTTNAPPGVFSPETIMAEYSVQQDVVTQPSALVLAALGIAQPSSIQAVLAHDFIATEPDIYLLYDRLSNFVRIGVDATDTHFYLRC